MMAGVEQIRDVIAFPKTQRGQDLLVDAPSAVTEQQLRDLHIRVRASDSLGRPADGPPRWRRPARWRTIARSVRDDVRLRSARGRNAAIVPGRRIAV